MVCGRSRSTGKSYVVEYWRERCGPGKVIGKIFELVERWSPVKVGIESVGYQKTMISWLRQAQLERRMFFLIEALEAGVRSKGMRILGLQPMIAAGGLLFRPHQTALRNELLTFPVGGKGHDDLADALAMQLQLWGPLDLEGPSGEEVEDPLSCESIERELEEKARKGTGRVSRMLRSGGFRVGEESWVGMN
jgi:predicted phage terminase large subunit-like protein